MKYFVFIYLAASVSASFSDDFFQILAKEDAEKNIVCSPLSLEIVMAMTYMGAKGNTAKELQTALKLPEDRNEVAKKYREFFTNLEGREKDAILELANRIYVNNQLELVPEYNKIVADSFKAEAVPINVDKNAAANINSWVSGHTRNKITEIVSPGDIDSGLLAVVINAIYFKGQWKHKFDKTRTRLENFRTSSNQIVPVDMMTANGYFLAEELRDLDAKVLELPYRNSSLSMKIFLPNKNDGLSKLERQIQSFARPLNRIKVNVKIPKFKVEFSKSLESLLKKLGITTAFSYVADLSGLVSAKARVSKVVQKTFLEVNEEGAEASAASAVSIVFRGGYEMDFHADHPFAFTIGDGNTIYFQGHYVSPAVEIKNR
ncbi:uncharacterized protein Dana_GF19634 [Drosophila ananassae]|uniref:Serpin domain-containing protein n=1 Tax=Drosophila ananassae TaxID=7217 RepID=B3N2J3_DROAN|nr:serine protease inhibitor 42Dd [Drosophila ananassae]EDV44857.2 uncharacterized protein Dana_GF19634 [Drosophila ananassae]